MAFIVSRCNRREPRWSNGAVGHLLGGGSSRRSHIMKKEADMRRHVSRSFIVFGLAAALAGGAYAGVSALPAPSGPRAAMNANDDREKHPVLRQSMHQLEAIKDRLQKAPTDFGGHREAAVDAINRAI